MTENNEGRFSFWEKISINLCTVGITLIAVSFIYRLYVFLKNGYNPEITIDTFFPQSPIEFDWKGVEIIYDFIVSVQIEFILVFFMCGLFVFSLWWSFRKIHKDD